MTKDIEAPSNGMEIIRSATAWADFAEKWKKSCSLDSVLAVWQGPWAISFDVSIEEKSVNFRFNDGKIDLHGSMPTESEERDFSLIAPEKVWNRFFQPVPVRHYHSIFAMLMRVPEFVLDGNALRFAQYCHIVRRVLELGKWLILHGEGAAPFSMRRSIASLGTATVPKDLKGGYVEVSAGGTRNSIYHETSGAGREIICLHTAGSDSRQFHRLMADPRFEGYRFVAFDLPWHGKSFSPCGAPPGSWSLNTDLYVDIIMGFIVAAGIEKPIVLGASMSGEICLELALRHPEAFSAIIACESSDKIEGRGVPWAFHPEVNQSIFVPEWIHGLMAPQSPAECAEEIWWHYSQGGCATFAKDINFYSGEWDARERVSQIDTERCPLFMLTGEYDYSCTAEHSAETASKIAGADFKVMKDLGHFPFAENPQLFGNYLKDILGKIPDLNDK